MLAREDTRGILEIVLVPNDFAKLSLSEGSVLCSLNHGANNVTVNRTNFCTESPDITLLDGNILVDFPIHYKNHHEIERIREKSYPILNRDRTPTGKSVRFSYQSS